MPLKFGTKGISDAHFYCNYQYQMQYLLYINIKLHEELSIRKKLYQKEDRDWGTLGRWHQQMCEKKNLPEEDWDLVVWPALQSTGMCQRVQSDFRSIYMNIVQHERVLGAQKRWPNSKTLRTGLKPCRPTAVAHTAEHLPPSVLGGLHLQRPCSRHRENRRAQRHFPRRPDDLLATTPASGPRKRGQSGLDRPARATHTPPEHQLQPS